MVILLRSPSGWNEVIKKILSDNGIPVYVESKSGYFTSYEVSVQSSRHKQMSNSPETVNKYFITEAEGLKWFEENGF